jgi:hypothetical protein
MEHIDIDTFKGYLKDNNIGPVKAFIVHDNLVLIEKECYINPSKLCLDEEDFKLYYNIGEQSLTCFFWGGAVKLLDKKFDYLKLMG